MELSHPLYVLLLTGLGALVLMTAWLPMLLRKAPLSLPILCVAVGAALFALPPLRQFAVHPLEFPLVVERLSELVVIVSLMGAGLKIDRMIGLRSWALTWRLLGIAMPITMLIVACLAWGLTGAGAAAALLIAAVLAPTDPVLASDVQVSGPGKGTEDEARFALTSEAGFNDGFAFPFVHLAIALTAATFVAGDLLEWFIRDLLWKTILGAAMGYAIGRGLGYLTFHLPMRANLSRTGDGFVALAATLLAYGVAEMLGGFGFLAVFVSALALRNASRDHEYHQRLHGFAEEAERLLMMVLLVLFGGMVAFGGLLASLDWRMLVFVAGVLLVARPAAGLFSLLGSNLPWREQLVISFFGIRGMGSIYYLAFALNHASFADPRRLWAIVGGVVLASILLHGITVTPALALLDRWQRRRGDISP
ncbi:putative Na(+)/H(+) antiporter [Sphingomonas changbaiensis NBRC 104936]|uniref:Putative Na(+)/H(+) antiporter n=1 Tax=Sphingomonas changbaiensis NBRC 104936 TaxID=1219043 RepID=A0A0E9MSP7_9SPHN|nr:cation:proton antiporter [Sphingomonas changbaiensis]GAO40594.1 putative Na(+)/H(+) antiporter [Sphingomonas changbaiensis NBRC 104936]